MNENSIIKVVQAGCGNMAPAWIVPTLEIPQLEYVGLADSNLDNARKIAARFGFEESILFDSLEEALTKTRPDVVFDVTVPAAHYEITMWALQHGCHVLGEKPMSDTLDNARRMVQAAQDSGKIYAVIQNRRYEPNIRRVREFLDTGALGMPHTICADFFLGPHFGGFRDLMAQPLLVDMAIHTFDAARYLAALDPVSVYCKSFNPAGSWYRGDACAIAIFEMKNAAENRVVFSYRGSWCAEGLPTSWQSSWRIIGEKGTLLWNGEDEIRVEVADEASTELTRPTREIEVPPGAMEHTRHAALIREFATCVRNDTTPQTHAADNIKSLAMVLGAVQSATTDQVIAICD
jgi:predicted dehydrogenase